MPQRLPRCGVDAAVQTVLLFARTGREEEAACRLTQQAIAEPQTPQPVDLQYLAIRPLQPVYESSRGCIERIYGPIAEVAHEQAIAELAKVRRRECDPPRC